MATTGTLSTDDADVVLIGGGIMSATLGSMLAVLQPDWRVILVEKADAIGVESSDTWNNAGTGHAGFCELNYMPDVTDGRKAEDIARQFQLSRQWWAFLAEKGLIDPQSFVRTTPHLAMVFGARDVEYLRARSAQLQTQPQFADLEYSEDPAVIAEWAPLTMAGRTVDGPIAASRHVGGTDVDYGTLSRALVELIRSRGGDIRLEHDVRTLTKQPDGGWVVAGRANGGRFSIKAKHVFVGAGGFALRLLQRAHLPEVKGYGVLPVGAAFFRTEKADIVKRHEVKVYGQSADGAPPMSIPHLDRRPVDGSDYLIFGPYATFSTKLLTRGKLTDFFTTLRWHNLHVMAAALLQNLGLIRYLVGQLTASPKKKFRQVTDYFPTARLEDWELTFAGQRAQLVVPVTGKVGMLKLGTELVTSADGSMSALLGASPGASTAVAIMLDLLPRCFPAQWSGAWSAMLHEAFPELGNTAWNADEVQASFARTAEALKLRK
ncbi:MAG: malate:quinone oxidoreductase [Microbacterium sp.]|uniref:malate:quinone oxidoreductase n=1 Tax=Microbacterium sp. TaxID=51671 RepID=UPI0039E6E4F2